jgi:DNA-binding IclR family transcriptional regulator
MTSHGKNDQHGIQSIEVGARLLEALARARGPMMLRDLAAQADMAPAKAHRYLVSFARMGLVEQHADTGRYDLGAFALHLGLSALGRLEPLDLAGPILQSLGEEIGQTVAAAVWGTHGATIVRWWGADAPVIASLRVGSVMPLTRSATGGIFLAFLSERATARFLTKELADNARLGLKPTDRKAVQSWVEQSRRNGVTRTRHFIPGISGVAAPVFDYNGNIALAIVALGYSAAFDLSLHGPIVTAVKDRARQLSERLGGTPTAMALPTGRT